MNLSNDLNLINDLNRDALKQAIRTAKPFPHFCIDNFLDPDFAESIYRSFPSFHDAQKMGTEFNRVNERGKIQVTDPAKFPEPIARLNRLLASQEFLDYMSDLMGIANLIADADLIGGGIHETNSGGRLDVHVDFNYIESKRLYRRLNILLYFNKDWRSEYGGYLDIWDSTVTRCYGRFAPRFNRACGFATSEISFHGVTPLTCPAHIMRRSFATYYYTKEAPDNWSGNVHSTIFKARPDEWMRGHLLMPAEGSVMRARRGYRRMKSSIKRLLGR
ncbi:MAG TPA: 2OG-Fe(II) oxygenase [Steroidobacteraceae bacterium]|nr:2OG-Fe(II) oxygenase [Steroidobacteraceae bacterium]